MQKTLLEAASSGHAVTYSGQAVSFKSACGLFSRVHILESEVNEIVLKAKAMPDADREQFIRAYVADLKATYKKSRCTAAAVSRAIARLNDRGMVMIGERGSYWLTVEGSLTIKKYRLTEESLLTDSQQAA
jgi:hypothetical protein